MSEGWILLVGGFHISNDVSATNINNSPLLPCRNIRRCLSEVTSSTLHVIINSTKLTCSWHCNLFIYIRLHILIGSHHLYPISLASPLRYHAADAITVTDPRSERSSSRGKQSPSHSSVPPPLLLMVWNVLSGTRKNLFHMGA